MKNLLTFACAAAALSCSLGAQAASDAAVWQFVSAGSEQTYAIKTDGTLWAWGSAEYGELGNGSKTPGKVSTPTQIGVEKTWKFAAGGSGRAFFIAEDGTLWSCGTAEGGVLGTNSAAAQTLPVQIGTDSDWKCVATSNSGMNYDALAIKTDGSLWGWGKNNIGCLGLGDFETYAVPQRIGTDNDWVSVSLGADHSLILKEDGTIWGAGNGSSRALGADNPGYNKTLVKVADAADWAQVYAIDNASYALKTDGTLWAWGENHNDVLGLSLNDGENTYVYTDEPTQVTAITEKVIGFAGSQYFRVAIVGEGSTATKAYAWGYNYLGELGNGTGVDRSDISGVQIFTTPQEVLFDAPVELTAVSAGQNFAVTLAAEGNLLGWGSNTWGQLGTSEPENMLGVYKTTPIQVAALPEVADPGAEFDAQNIPATLANVEKIVLKGEWTTDDLKKLNAPLGNGGNFMGFTYNTTLKTVDMSQATFAESTSFEKVFFNCSELETIIFPETTLENVTSLNCAFLNDRKLASVNVAGLVNVSDITQAFQNCKELTELNLAAWHGVDKSEMAFQNCSNLTSIALPGNMTIEDRCFGGCDSLVLIDWSAYEGTTAPEFSITDNFNPFYATVFAPGSAAKITLIVPAAAYESFTTDAFWKDFNVQMAAAPGTYTVDADGIPASLADAIHLILTGSWDTSKFAALAASLGTASGVSAANNTLVSIDMSAAEIASNTKLKMQVPGALWGTVDKGVFQKFTALETVIMPAAEQAANFTSFVQAFQDCSALTSIDLSGCTGLTETVDAFYNCSALASVKFPAQLPLNKEMFDRCVALTTIDWTLFSGTQAPSFSMSALPSLSDPKNLTVIVPAAAYELFVADDNWSIYNIVKGDVSGITDVVSGDMPDAPCAVFDISGRRVKTLAPGENETVLPAGLYIIAGKKVLVK